MEEEAGRDFDPVDVDFDADDDDDAEVVSDNEDSGLENSESSSSSSVSMGSEHSSGAGSGQDARSPARRRRHEKKSKISFNRALPATHSYLGEDLEEAAGGQAVMEAEAVKEAVPLFAVPNLILMPGQTLPLRNLTFRHASMFQQIITYHKLFAVLTLRAKEDEAGGYELANVGTLAQVMEFKEETEAGLTSVKAKAVGRQRFELLEKQRLIDGTQACKVRILPEYSLPDSLQCFSLSCMSKFKLLPLCKQQERRQTKSKYGKYFCSVLSPWPWFIYKQCDMEEIVEQVCVELSCWYDEDKIRKMSENRTEFSFWVASNLPLDNLQKLQLLSVNCTLQRLKSELLLLKKCTMLCCQRCEQVVGDKADIFSMSVDGPMGAYVNPGGVIHEMFTLLAAQGISVVSGPNTENSWFPGYAWSILECSGCHSHAGWRFKSTRKNLKPSKFWGLTRAAIKPKMKDEHDDFT